MPVDEGETLAASLGEEPFHCCANDTFGLFPLVNNTNTLLQLHIKVCVTLIKSLEGTKEDKMKTGCQNKRQKGNDYSKIVK